jgi:two-component system OmpR family sensor kinase
MTIRTRLSLWYGAALALTLLAVGLAVWVEFGAELRDSLDGALETQAADVRHAIASSGGATVPDEDPIRPGVFVVIFDGSGGVLHATPDAPAGLALPSPGVSTGRLGPGASGYALYALAAPDGWTVVAGSSLDEIDQNLADLAGLFALVGVAAGLLSLVGGWWLAGRALGPVDLLTREAEAIGLSELDRRLPEPRRLDELGRLARTLNAMLARVEDGVQRQREFVAGASHDLRTPIAALRTELELAQRRPGDADALLAAIRAAHADAVRLGDLTADLLGLAEAEISGRSLVRQTVPIQQLILGTVQRVEPLAAERDLTVVVTAPAESVAVDRVRLEQALVNLLSNAIRHAPPGSRVEVEAAVTAGGGASAGGHRSLEVAVLDRGPGVPVELRPTLFVPFVRGVRPTGPGSGLGLATAAAAIAAHRGEIDYEDRPGGGSRFWFRIPV